MRRKLLVQRFVMALTSGQSSVRPIEMQAHDPVRCVDERQKAPVGHDIAVGRTRCPHGSSCWRRSTA